MEPGAGIRPISRAEFLSARVRPMRGVFLASDDASFRLSRPSSPFFVQVSGVRAAELRELLLLPELPGRSSFPPRVTSRDKTRWRAEVAGSLGGLAH